MTMKTLNLVHPCQICGGIRIGEAMGDGESMAHTMACARFRRLEKIVFALAQDYLGPWGPGRSLTGTSLRKVVEELGEDIVKEGGQ